MPEVDCAAEGSGRCRALTGLERGTGPADPYDATSLGGRDAVCESLVIEWLDR